MPEPLIDLELVIVRAGGVCRLPMRMPAGATLAAALERAVQGGLVSAEEVLNRSVAVFGRLAAPGQPLADGDRIELLGPLQVDPKVARQRRVAHRRAAAPRDKWRGG